MMRKKMNALWMKPVLVCAVLCVCLLNVYGRCLADDVDRLIAVIQSKDIRPIDKLDEIEELGALKDTRAVEPLIKILIDEYSIVRYKAALALGMIGDERAVEPLIEILEGRHQRNIFSRAFRYINSQVNPISKAMDSFALGGPVGDREGIAYALGKIGDTRAIEPLIKATRDRDKTVRREAIDALGNFNDPRVIKTLEKIAQNEMGISGYSAEKALENIANIQNS
jgi:HEAT repeat protein